MKPLRVMPDQVKLGQSSMSPISTPLLKYENLAEDIKAGHYPEQIDKKLRTVMGYFLPKWQRSLVWTKSQKIALIELLWRGVPIGTFTYTRLELYHPNDNLLIDGQQRMSAIQDYIEDKFPVFGYKFSQITEVDRRFFEMLPFPSYIVTGKYGDDDEYLRNYYNIMNFSGIAHTPSQRA